MRDASTSLLDLYLPDKDSGRQILDAGCGTGGMLPTLRGYGRTIGVDFSSEALQLARQRDSSPLIRADVCHLPFTSESFDVVTSFDVIYHRAVTSDIDAIVEMARVLRPKGLLLIRVPALNLVLGRHDVAVHTLRRYTRRELDKKLKQNGFALEFISYLNCSLLPLAVLRRAVDRFFHPGRKDSEVEAITPWLNHTFYRILRLETRWMRFGRLPLGLSLVAVARKVIRSPGTASR
jgi:SAM-dependent methyltransferase